MMKKLLVLAALVLSLNSFAVTHTYYFKIQGVTNFEEAKYKIDEMRSILGIKMFLFDDVTDTFKTISQWAYNWDDMAEDLAQFSIFLDGPVEHFISE